MCLLFHVHFIPLLQHNPNVEPVGNGNGNTFPETKTVPAENGNMSETQDKDVVSEGSSAVSVYDQWVAPLVSGPRPKPRYEVFALLLILCN